MIPEIDVRDRERFEAEFYAPEQPVILRNVHGTSLDVDTLCRELDARIARDPLAREQMLWYDVSPEVLQDLCATPEVVAERLDERISFLRKNFLRVWFSHGGHKTPWHYDGRSLHVFNLQLRGRKRWKIVAPESPLMCLPFTSVCLFQQYELAGHRYYEFETHEGDMLFLPRYWFHYVESLDTKNVNVNWVMTPRKVAGRTAGARREAEIVWLREKLRPVLPESARLFMETDAGVMETDAGAGKAAIDVVTSDVSALRALLRVGVEALKVPLIVVALPVLAEKVRILRRGKRALRAVLDTRGAISPGNSVVY
jgi:hypothetical protein